MPIQLDQDSSAKEVMGLSSYPEKTEIVSLTTAFQTLVPSPASGIKRVNQIILVNEDASITADFHVKIVRSEVDYLPIVFTLAPYERFVLNFPFLLDTTTNIQAKTSASVAGRAIASWITWYGGMYVLNFSGTTWTDLVTASTSPLGVFGVAIQNTGTTSNYLGCRVTDGSGTEIFSAYKMLSTNAIWLLDWKIALPLNWKIQVQHGAEINGSAVASVAVLP